MKVIISTIQIIFLLVFVSVSANSQGAEVISAQRTLLNLTRDSRLAPIIDLSNISGTPYFDQIFRTGIVFSNNGHFPNLEVRYNIYNDLMEFKQKNQIMSLSPVPPIERVVFNGNTFEVCKFNFKGEEKTGFFLLIDSGKVSLYTKMNVSFKEKEEPKPMSYSDNSSKFTRLSDTYYIKTGGEMKKLSTGKKVIDSFPDQIEKLQEFAKENGLTLKESSDLVALNKFYNSL